MSLPSVPDNPATPATPAEPTTPNAAAELLSAQQMNAQLVQQLKVFEGVDPKKYSEMIKANETAEQDRMAKAGDFDKMRETMAATHKTQLDKLSDELNIIRQQKKKADYENGVVAAIGDSAIPQLLMPAIEKSYKTAKMPDGTERLCVVDDNGNQRYSAN